MREKRTVQHSIFDFYADHEIGQELQAISNWLDSHPEVLDWVEADLRPLPVADCGRKGLPVESVLRCAILKQYRQVSYEDGVFPDRFVFVSGICTFAYGDHTQESGFTTDDQPDYRSDLGEDQSCNAGTRTG